MTHKLKFLSTWLRPARKSLDVSDEAQVDRVKQLVGDAVFKNLAVRVKLDKKPESDTPVDAFVEELKKIPNLHFAATPEDHAEEKK